MMNRRSFSVSALTAVILLCLQVKIVVADEWKARHDLVSHTGVMNLTEPPPPSEVFFSGPMSPLEQANWLTGLKAWRNRRRTLLRYSESEFERTELEWTQHLFSQVQLLIWDRSFYDPEKG
jgi:hypothetical protein